MFSEQRDEKTAHLLAVDSASGEFLFETQLQLQEPAVVYDIVVVDDSHLLLSSYMALFLVKLVQDSFKVSRVVCEFPLDDKVV